MSMRTDADDVPTDGRAYRRSQSKLIQEQRARLRRLRDAGGRGDAIVPAPSAPPPPATDPNNANPWTREFAQQLWTDLVAQSGGARSTTTLSLPQFIKALYRGDAVIRARFGLPSPTLGVQSRAQVDNRNAEYVTKLYGLINGGKPFNAEQLIAYLTKPGPNNPLSRVLLTTQARLPSLAGLRL